MNSDFSNIIINSSTDFYGFEKEISTQITSISKMVESSRDIESLIFDALMRRCNDLKTVMHAQLRLKNGANSEVYTMKRNELADLAAEMIASKDAANIIFKRLANFYVRIASLHNRIEHVRQCSPAMQLAAMEGMHNDTLNHRLLMAYEKNEKNMREKHHQNHRDLNQIMQTLFLDSEIHPELTLDDLPALEMQVEHIAQRGCAVQELRRLKIIEALLEGDRFHKLMQELSDHDILPRV